MSRYPPASSISYDVAAQLKVPFQAGMHAWLLRTWYGGSASGFWLRPFGWLFGALSALRRAAYRMGWLASYRSRRPVVVVGNLSVGGTGKTPLVIWLAGQLAALGLRIGVASRGHGGKAAVARRIGDRDPASEVGDEPALIRRRLGVPVATGTRRADAVRLLEPDCDLILCDDGLQHYALARDFEIAVVDGARGLGNGRLLPAGPLREPSARLAAVDAVVVNGAGFAWPGAIGMELVPDAAVTLDGRERRALSQFSGRKVHAVAAIGHPARFFSMLRRYGLEVVEHALPDHAAVLPASLGPLTGLPVLMTEKDAVKCQPGAWQDAWSVEVQARLDGPGAVELCERIARLVSAREQGNPG